jgi:superfamily II DNA or RNA helicase
LLNQYLIDSCVQDKRILGSPLHAKFEGELLAEQKVALVDLLAHDIGVLHAPPGFGKTVTAAAIIAERDCSTLIIVHTTALLRQWQSRLAEFLSVEPESVNSIPIRVNNILL